MAIPRVFISSTFYDLKQVRNNIGEFVKSLGYDTVMNEKSEIAYTEDVPLEQNCYNELIGCDMVVCIIGNNFGSESEFNELSITMNEINNAIKNKKKVYVFIIKNLFIENKTYELNKDAGSFKSAYTDNIKVHEYISKLKNNRRIVINDFETTDQIINTLKAQWAGLFQNLLSREASLTDAKTLNDLQESADKIQSIIDNLCDSQEDFFCKFSSTVFYPNKVIIRLKQLLKFNNFSFFIENIDALDEFMVALGYISESIDDNEIIRIYSKKENNFIYEFKFLRQLFNDDGEILKNLSNQQIKEFLLYKEIPYFDDDDDIPF